MFETEVTFISNLLGVNVVRLNELPVIGISTQNHYTDTFNCPIDSPPLAGKIILCRPNQGRKREN